MSGSERDEEPADVEKDADTDEIDVGEDPAADEADSEEEWQFSLEDIERREADREAAQRAAAERAEPLTPGDPSLEGALFVLLGAAIAVFALSRLFVG